MSAGAMTELLFTVRAKSDRAKALQAMTERVVIEKAEKSWTMTEWADWSKP